jgi:F-type H+-transporting ATPase subunit b
MKYLIALILLVTTSQVLAAGGGSHGSVGDLLFPAINFFALLAGLIYLMRKPMAEMFTNNAKEVTNLFEYAEKKDKEAKIKLEMFQKKMENLDGEKNKIIKNAENEASAFIESSKNESGEYLKRLAEDSKAKVQYEKSSLEDEIRESLVNEVINKAKEKISSDKELTNKATKKLISQIK